VQSSVPAIPAKVPDTFFLCCNTPASLVPDTRTLRMSRILASLTLLLLFSGTVWAQELPEPQSRDGGTSSEKIAPPLRQLPPMVAPDATQAGPTQPPSFAYPQTDVAPLDPMHYYGSYARPRDAVRRNAALKAAQRRERIAVRKAMGYSPLRPPSSSVPFMAGPSPYSIIRPPLRFPTIIIGRPAVTVLP
jgi:hypothetical protein